MTRKEKVMETRVLVTYASKYGSTAEIAEKIAEVLHQTGLATDVLSVEQVADVKPYQAVILGTAVYVGRWRKSAIRFLKHHEEVLAERKVWIFASGPTGNEKITHAAEGWHLSKKLETMLEHVAPRNLTLFHGCINPEKLTGIEKWIINRVKAPVGDFRNWEAITSWASEIATDLKQSTFPPA
jgi:menaquinone-dependent protoporphyrinogen oxidase